MKTLLCLFAVPFALVAGDTHSIKGPMPAREGEICVVCYGKTAASDVAYEVDGERYAVMRQFESEFVLRPFPIIEQFRRDHPTPSQNNSWLGGAMPYYLGMAALYAVLGSIFWVRHRRKSNPEPPMSNS